jgi:pimeloyl-ACP methyl ester carboxylesterase
MSEHEPVLEKAISRDGTPIGYFRSGQGPALVLVHGTAADHTRWETVLPLLEPHATVYAMDRRGRGASGDAADYSLEAEVADVAAVVEAVADATGGPVDVFGHSYGALCCVEAALLTAGIRRLVLYEPPMVTVSPPGWTDRMEDLLAQGRREDVVIALLGELAGMPEDQLKRAMALPSWANRVAAAHTVVRETRAEEEYRFDPARFASLAVPTLLLVGTKSPPDLVAPSRGLAGALLNARVVELAGQGHVAMLTAPELFVTEVLGFLRGD